MFGYLYPRFDIAEKAALWESHFFPPSISLYSRFTRLSSDPPRIHSSYCKRRKHWEHSQAMHVDNYQYLRNGTAFGKMWNDLCECDFVAPGTSILKKLHCEQPLTKMIDIAGIAIFWCHEITYLLRWFLPGNPVPSLSRQPYAPKTTIVRRALGPHPSHMTELALGFSFAIEYPLIVAYHPWTQRNGVSYSVPLLQPTEAITQFIIFSLVEEILKSRFMWFLTPCAGQSGGKHSLNGPHSAACGLTIDYLLPKATIWMAIMVIWMVYLLTGITGKLQMFQIIVWVVVRQFWGRGSFLCPHGFL